MAGRTRSDIDIEIGRRLRRARHRLGLTQEEVGETIGVSHQQIQKYERGDTRLTLSTLARLRELLRIEAADLLPRCATTAAPSPSRSRPWASPSPASTWPTSSAA